MRIKFDRRGGLYLSWSKRFLWVTRSRTSGTDIAHPNGNAWGLWREDGETFLNAGPLVAALGLHKPVPQGA